MGHGVDFHGANKVLNAPAGHEETVTPLRVYSNGQCCVSCWQLSPEELADINANGGKVYLSVFMGKTMPPVYVGSEETTRGLVVDYGGVWKK